MKTIFNPFTKNLQYTQDNRINKEILIGNKTLIPGVDPPYQYLDPDDADRVITLDTTNATAGDRFFIMHNGDWNDVNYLDVKQDVTSLDKVYVFAKKEFIFNGSDWVGVMTGTGSESSMAGITIGKGAQAKEIGIAIGHGANAVLDGVAIGGGSVDAHDYGTAIGYDSDGNTRGIAIGHSTNAAGRGTALGFATHCRSNEASIAIGYRSKNSRQAEFAMNIGDPTEADINKAYNQIVIGSWIRQTINATPTTMYVNGSSSSRFTIRPQSALTFKIMVTARDNTSGDCAAYLFDGLIKRDGSNNTTLCTSNKTILHEDDDTWDCDIAADDTNEALQITVTGDADNTVKWAARLDGVETSWSSLQV